MNSQSNGDAKSASSSAAGAAPNSPLPGGPQAGFLVWDLSRVGYTSEEYLLAGVADVAEPIAVVDGLPRTSGEGGANGLTAPPLDFKPKVIEGAVPFVTRVIVYRPKDPKAFSGRVLMEPLHIGGGGHPVVFRTIHPFAIANGDIFVGVQHPNNFDEVRGRDPARYGALRASSPTQLWGMIAAAGRAVRQGGLAGLKGYDVKRQYLTGRSFTGMATSAFANYHHERAKLDDGRNIFDGYLPLSCGYLIRGLDVPVIRLNTLGDYAMFGLHTRLPDSDEPGRQTRLYEVAGACHYYKYAPPAGEPPAPGRGAADGEGAGPPGTPEWLASFGPGSRPNDLPVRLVASAALANLYRWVEDGVAPPHAPMFETRADGKPVMDAQGNVRGGVRTPYVDAPVATYGAGEGQFWLHGYARPFNTSELKALYGDRETYLAKFKASLERAVSDRWVLPDDAPLMLADAEAVSFD